MSTATELLRRALESLEDWKEERNATCDDVLIEEIRAFLAAETEKERLHRRIEILDAEKCFAISRYESAVKLLTGIHSLLYPPAIKLPDGRTMVFRPKDPDPHTLLQELSDRIRALPDEIERLHGLTLQDMCRGDK
jgi:hypothetical protein